MTERDCYRCGEKMTPGTLTGTWEVRRFLGQKSPVIRSMDMTGCPVEECKNCGNYVWNYESDDWYVEAYKKVFFDLMPKKEATDDR